MVADVVPVDVELCVVVHVHHLVNERVLHVFFIYKAVLAEHDAVVRTEAASELLVARRAEDMRGRDPVGHECELLRHEHHSGTYI